MLSTEGLEVYYGRVKTLFGISIQVPNAKLVAVLGSNGAGKSTLLGAIMGMKFCSYGEVIFEGRRIENMRPSKLVAMGMTMVPEGRHVFPELTVEENLLMGAFLRSDGKKIKGDVDMVFSLFPQLKARRKQEGRFLSGGELQMVALGRALMAKPKLLLLDEPSMGLAPVAVKDLFATIEGLHKEGLTILLVEQNVNLALGIASFGYVMQSGKIERYGTSEKLLNDEEVKGAYLGEGRYVDKKEVWGGKIKIKK